MSLSSIALTIAEALKPQVIEAFEYLDEHAALERAGVGLTDIRHALECELDETPALAAVRGWSDAGEPGTFTAHGARDGGKSLAAVQWLRWQHAAGVPGIWVSDASLAGMNLDALDAVIVKVKQARALVWDDAGSKPMPAVKQDDLRAALVTRWESGWPTLITSNANEAETDVWLGERLSSRVSMRGGFHHVETGLGYRDRPDFTTHMRGRGPRWVAADLLVSCIGCKRESQWVPRSITMQGDDGSTWEALDGDYKHALTVGQALVSEVARRASMQRRPAKYLGEVCDRYKLDRAEIRAKAEADDLVFEQRRRDVNDRLEQVRERKIREYAAMRDAEPRPSTRQPSGVPGTGVRSPAIRDAPAWALGEGRRQRLGARGFSVEPMIKGQARASCSRWRAVYHPPKGKFERLVLGFDIDEEEDAWKLCASMAGPYPPANDYDVESRRARAM